MRAPLIVIIIFSFITIFVFTFAGFNTFIKQSQEGIPGLEHCETETDPIQIQLCKDTQSSYQAGQFIGIFLFVGLPTLFSLGYILLSFTALSRKSKRMAKFIFICSVIPLLSPGLCLGIIPGIIGLISLKKENSSAATDIA